MLTVTLPRADRTEPRRLIQLRLLSSVEDYFKAKIPDGGSSISLPALLTTILEEIATKNLLTVQVEE